MIVERLKSLRKSNKVSQKDFAQALKVSQQTVASWEVGRTEPSNVALKEIADYFNVSTDYLLGNRIVCETFSDEEKQLVDDYRYLDIEGKRLIRSVIKRFRGTILQTSSPNVYKTGSNFGLVSGNFSSNVTLGK